MGVLRPVGASSECKGGAVPSIRGPACEPDGVEGDEEDVHKQYTLHILDGERWASVARVR